MILLLTHSGDYYTIDRVEAALGERGAACFRVDTDRFPVQYLLTGELSADGPVHWLEAAGFPPGGGGKGGLFGQRLALDEVQAVWSRRLWPGRLPEDFEPTLASQCYNTCRTAFLDIFCRLEQAFWINPIREGERAESKILQLELAAELGFRVPDTLITNSPERVRDFYERHGGELCTKLLVPTAQSMDADPSFVYTCRLEEQHLERLESLRCMPQIFQPFLPKRRELRIAVVGDRLFGGGFEVPQSGPAAVDWRQATPEDGLTWSPVECGTTLRDKILRLLERLGLRFAALDFADDGSGEEPYFLELNQAGEWGWLERDLGLPISGALADALMTGGGR